MKVGSLVKFKWPNIWGSHSGIVVEVNRCNVELEVKVLWPDGKIEVFDKYELDIIEVV